jgi:hypothetical protein
MRPVRDATLLANAVDLAREAAVAEAATDLPVGPAAVGAHLESLAEDDGSVTHYFAAEQGGYRGWSWAVTLAAGAPEGPVTVSEVVLIPGAEALIAPGWVPWERRIGPATRRRPLPSRDDPRLVPGYVASDDPAVEDVAREVGLGRERVLSRVGREQAAERWQDGPRGPGSDMARSAPGSCGTCGFFLTLAGSLRGAFGVCGNAYAPGCRT